MRLGVLILLAGCVPQYDPCFTPEMLLLEPRVIAVRADPPELPLSGGDVMVRALAGGPRGPVDAARGSVRLCVPEGRCVLEVEGAVRDGELAVTLPVEAALVEEARRADALAGYGGVRLDARVQVEGLAEVHKALLFSAGRPNGPIELDGFEVTRHAAYVGTTRGGALPGLIVGYTYGLRPLVIAGEEEFDVVDLGGHVEHLRERISYDFFSSGGVVYGDLPYGPRGPTAYFGDLAATGAYADEPAPGEAAPANGLVHAVVFGSAWVWAVARDGRGAVAWTSTHVKGVPGVQVAPGDIIGCPPR